MKNNFFYLLFFSAILVLARLIPHPPNFSPVIAFAILAPMLTKDRLLGIAIPILGMFLSDIVIGFHSYQFVIYTVLISISVLSPFKKNYFNLGLLAIGGSIWFFITTNFAVWIVWDYYPKNLEGLVNCYTLAIPFFKNTLISTILFTGILSYFSQYLEMANKNTSTNLNNFINLLKN